MLRLTPNDRLGLLKPSTDAHTLGINNLARLLQQCGVTVVMADQTTNNAICNLTQQQNATTLRQWIAENRLTCLGFSYRLNPPDAYHLFWELQQFLQTSGLSSQIKGLCFAGLPSACEVVKAIYGDQVTVFAGNETATETLASLGIAHIAPSRVEDLYDETRLSFARSLIAKEEYHYVSPRRIRHSPLTRAHLGPYSDNREVAVRLFLDWCRQLAQTGYLDILSVGTSQLTQSHFGQEWGSLQNGGGVPINSPDEYRRVFEASRPMMVRTYAGTSHIPELARMHEETIDIAWHALSFWWFCQLDGRGPNPLYENLRQHLETLDFVAQTRKGFEPNCAHHFAFRGADDVSCIVSVYLASRIALQKGVCHLILPVMLNTPKTLTGIQDLAKTRATVKLIRTLESAKFRISLQPRAGLEGFPSNLYDAKVHLASATALMDDIEPENPNSPQIIHIVGYSEASQLSTPEIVDESIKITFQALTEYRKERSKGHVPDMTHNQDVQERTMALYNEACDLISQIDRDVPHMDTAVGLYRLFAAGYLPVPDLAGCRDQFPHALNWNLRSAISGGKRCTHLTSQGA